MQKVDFSYNLLGVTNNIKEKVEEPSILELTEVFLRSDKLEEIDLSYNSIDCVGVYCISYGLERTVSLKKIVLTGNSIGSTGVRCLAQAVRCNPNKQFTNFVVDDTLAATDSSQAMPSYGIDIMKPEGDYALDLGKAFDRLKLRKLLDLDLSLSENFPGTTFGQCFVRMRLDPGGKAFPIPHKDRSWNDNWQFDLNLKGILRFSFSLKHLKSLAPKATPTEIIEQIKKGNTENRNITESDFSSVCKLIEDFNKKGKQSQIANR